MPAALFQLELDTDNDFDILEYLQSFGEEERAVIIRSAIREQMQSADFESQILERLNNMSTTLESLQKDLATLRASASITMGERRFTGLFPDAEKNLDKLMDF